MAFCSTMKSISKKSFNREAKECTHVGGIDLVLVVSQNQATWSHCT